MRGLTNLSIIITLLAILSLVACGSDDSADDSASATTAVPSDSSTAQPASDSGTTAVDTTIVAVTNQDAGGSGQFKFEPSELTFSVGETVEFRISAETEFHTFTVDELGIDVEIEGGETETLTFTFDKPGEYKLFCIPHEPLGMVGTIIVE